MKIQYGIALILISLFSCRSSDSEDQSNFVTPYEPGKFTGLVNGVPKTVSNEGVTHYVTWKKVHDDYYDKTFYVFSISGFNQGFNFYYKIYTNQIEVNKTYTFEYSESNSEIEYSEKPENPTHINWSYWSSSSNFYTPSIGKFKVTKFNGDKMSGQFEAVLNHQYYGMTQNQTRSINGYFTNAEKAFGSL